MKFIDLFCGMGSFHQSFKKLGWTCVMACDIDEAARKTYAANHGIEPLGDICEIDPTKVPAYDVVCAGFPCQPFSQAGHHRGFEDPRGTMFFQVMKFVQRRPIAVILENVPALLTHDSGATFQRIVSELDTAGYDVHHKLLKCSDLGIPQNRKRLIILGVRKDVPKRAVNVWDLSAYQSSVTLSEYLGRNYARKVAFTIRCGGRNSPINDRHNWDGYWVDGKETRLTIEDALRLQGFPDTFHLEGTQSEKWHQLGNTIPTVFTEVVGLRLQELLGSPPAGEALLQGHQT
jgi:DNA (cytosine-5)-methyltransferase 1